jgi:hypothetical protein
MRHCRVHPCNPFDHVYYIEMDYRYFVEQKPVMTAE